MKRTSPVSRSGRFAGEPAAAVAQFTESISFDWRLWREDIAGSMAHATMLREVGCLTRGELRAIINGLEAIAKEIQAGKFQWRAELEDVHMNIESALTSRAPAGAKLHTGRSRNDQVALDIRLWLREQIVELQQELRLLQQVLVELGERESEVVIPGYTHMQRAQPVYLTHHLVAYVEMLERDCQRLQECLARVNVCPLGSGALAGSTLPLDRELVADLLGFVGARGRPPGTQNSMAAERDCQRLQECLARVNVCPLGSGALAGSTLPLDRELVADLLGFVDARGRPQVTQNSMDAVSDRDFAVEFCASAALLAVHLSRLAEDLILWSSSEFSFIRIDDAYTTGSSLMPQKKNPDVAELIRGKSGRVIGNLVALLTLLKGLPMTYNRDLQEDKERLFDTADTVRAAVRLG